jgi:hypothetical protein
VDVLSVQLALSLSTHIMMHDELMMYVQRTLARDGPILGGFVLSPTFSTTLESSLTRRTSHLSFFFHAMSTGATYSASVPQREERNRETHNRDCDPPLLFVTK